MLLAADAVRPSVATIVAGEPVRGSWWAHPKSHAIFAAITALSRHPDVIAVPLVANKVTFVHRALWPALLAIALEPDRLRTRGLSPGARALLRRVRRAGALEASGDAVRELERRLLVRSAEVHTARGSHGKIVEDWTRWAAREGVAPLADVADARAIIARASG